jgi:hypothetical protein
MKILTTTILMLAFVSTLTPTFQIGDTLTQEQAVKIAERFIIDNGYTSLPADKSKLNYELLDQLGENNLDSILKWRHNTLQLKAFCILEDEDKWDIGFLSTKVDLSKLDSIQRQKNLRGRSIVVTKDGKEIRMEHKDPLFSYFIKL